MPLTIGPNDKNLAKTLTGSEELIAPTQMNLKTIAAAADLAPDEVAALRGAGEVLLQVRVRREFPVLGRVFDDLLSRLKDGTPTKPLTEGETRALVELMGSLSHAEHDALVLLKNRGVIQSQHWDAVVVPHRDASNAEQDARLNKAKWGLANIANMSAPVGAAILVSTVASGGVIGMVGATAVALGMGLTVTPKIGKEIQTAGRVEARTLGMNALEGKEVSSEVVLMASRLAEGAVFEGKGRIGERLNTEVELGTLALNAREKAAIPWSPEEQPFMPLAQDWYYGLADLLAAHEKQPMNDAALRGKAFALRGEVMRPERLEVLAKGFIATTLAARTEVDPKLQGLVYLGHVVETTEQIAAALQKSGGKPTDDVKEAASSLVQLAELVRPEIKGHMPASLKKALSELAAGGTTTSLTQGVADARRTLDDERRASGLYREEAKNQVKLAFRALWGQILPSFQDVKDTPKLKIKQTEPDVDGGYVVRGAVKHGWFGSEGSFEMKLSSAGLVDADSIKIDLGPTFAVQAAKNAFERAGEMLGKDVRVRIADLVQAGTAGGDPYVVRCMLDGGATCDVKVSAMGMVDWATVRV